MSSYKIGPEAVAADPARFRPLFGMEPGAEVPAAPQAPEGEDGSEDETPAGQVPALDAGKDAATEAGAGQ